MSKIKVLNNKKLTITLLLFFFLISMIFTLIQTGFVLKNEYYQSIQTVKQSINMVKISRIKSISASMWQLDDYQLKIAIDSILKLPGIVYLEIRDNKTVSSYGKKSKKYTMNDTFDIVYDNFKKEKLGSIFIQGSYEESMDKIFSEIVKKILIEIFKVFLETFMLIFIVQKLIIKHLGTMASYIENLNYKTLSRPLILNKKRDNRRDDFIDIVVNGINKMRENLLGDMEKMAYQKVDLELTNSQLKEEIRVRTKIEHDALVQKERTQKQYNTIAKLTLNNEFFDRTFKDGMSFLLKESAKTLDAEKVSFWILKDENLECVYRYSITQNASVDSNMILNASEIKGFLAHMKRHKVIDSFDVYRDRRIGDANHKIMKKEGIKSMMNVGINFHDDLYGIIAYATLTKQKMWTQDEVSFVSRVSDQVSNLLLIGEWKKIKDEITELNNGLEVTIEKRTQELQQNIEELKIAQDHLVESEKMASLGGLVAGVAHEINTPVGISLTGITHFQHITKELKNLYDNENLSQEEFETYVSTSYEIAESVYKSLTRAAEQIKSFKQVAVDQSNEQIRSFNVREYIEEILLSLHNRTKKTKHKIIVDCDNKLAIRSYPGSISQILTNFVMNSLIHGFKDIEKGDINICVKQENNNIKFIYKDNGVGMSEVNLKKIFDPFFTTNREGGGSGLGLNIVYNIVTNGLNGNIKVESKSNEGIKFTITFPLIKEAS